MLINDVFKDYLSYIKYEENFTTNTVNAYKRDIQELIRYLAENNILIINDIIYSHMRAYISSLYDNLDKTSIARRVSSIRSFLKYCVNKVYLDQNILTKITRPKQAKKISFALRENEYDRMSTNTASKNELINIRNLAILELLYATGIRVSELVNIKVNDIDFTNNIIKVFGKGRKERIVPFNDLAKESLLVYYKKRHKFLREDCSYLFLNNFGKNLSTRTVQRLMKVLSIKAGLLKTATPHTIRHSFATHILERGAGIKTVKELLGHKSISATERYTHLSMESLIKTYKKSHPKGNE